MTEQVAIVEALVDYEGFKPEITKEERVAKLKVIIDEMAKDLKPLVEKIEAKRPTTKNHYGDYMGVISAAGNNAFTQKIILAALLDAGANPAGVASAYKIIRG